MSWIIQKPSTVFTNRSMYFKEIEITDDVKRVLFNHWIGHAQQFEIKDDAKKIIKDYELTDCHIIPG